MELNYIILAHKNPAQLSRLLKRLEATETYFYIHIDKQVAIEPFEKAIQGIKNVFLLKEEQREKGTWGDIDIVKAILNGLSQIVKDGRTGYCLLLSGQDYPLKSKEFIQNYFIQKSDTHFIDLFKMPGEWKKEGMARIDKYKINKSLNRGHFTLLPSIFDKEFYSFETLGKINYLRKSGKIKFIFKIFKKRIFPKYLEAYGGSVYWALPIETVKKILIFIERHPDYLQYHQYTLCVDEIFFHSILMYLNKQELLKIAPSLTYVNWERKSGPLPVTFKIEDFKELKLASKSFLFARKFDIKLNEKILDKWDRNL